jgi:hypothetical protein
MLRARRPLRRGIAPGGASFRLALLLGLLVVSSAGVSAAGGSTHVNGKRSTTPVRVTFSATGGGEYKDVFRLLTDVGRECYARNTEDQTLSLSWNLGWNAAVVEGSRFQLRVTGRAVGEVAGSVTGTSVRDGCDEPDEADPLWVGSDRCDGRLPVVRGGRLEPGRPGRDGSAPLVLLGPHFGSLPAPCEMDVRNDQLVAHVALGQDALARIARGKVLTLPLGTSHPRAGDAFLAVRSCTDVPHTYDGWVWLYDCTDELTWEGTLTIAPR